MQESLGVDSLLETEMLWLGDMRDVRGWNKTP